MFIVHVSCDSIFNRYFLKLQYYHENFGSPNYFISFLFIKYFFYSIQSFLKQDFLAGCICIIGGNKISEPCRERNLWGLGLLVSTSVGQASLERGTGQGNFRGHGGGQLVKTNRIVVWYVGIQFLAAILFSCCICWWVQIMFPLRCKCLEFRIIREGFL